MNSGTAKKVVVLDYGFGNVRSAERALARAGADVEITRDYDTAMNADGLLVPGVGAFSACMAGLKEARGDWIIGRRLAGGRPVMGVCVGMQVLFARGVEHGVETEASTSGPGRSAPSGRPSSRTWGGTPSRRPGTARCSPGSTPGSGSTSCTRTP